MNSDTAKALRHLSEAALNRAEKLRAMTGSTTSPNVLMPLIDLNADLIKLLDALASATDPPDGLMA